MGSSTSDPQGSADIQWCDSYTNRITTASVYRFTPVLFRNEPFIRSGIITYEAAAIVKRHARFKKGLDVVTGQPRGLKHPETLYASAAPAI